MALFLVFALGVILGSTIGFIDEISKGNPNHTLIDDLFNFYCKPLCWLFLHGGIPVIFCGLILGIYLKEIENSDC